MAQILLVEDENLLRWAVMRRLEKAGHIVYSAATLAEAEDHLGRYRPDVVLLDINLPDGNGLDFLANQRENLSESIVVVVTAVDEVQQVVRAMRLGAWDFLHKPVEPEELLSLIERAQARQSERTEAEASRRGREALRGVKIIAESDAMRSVLALTDQVAASPATTVLIQGETGTGKELLARAIHDLSSRRQGTFVKLNCAALPETLAETELFGHERGAFTDAKAARKGLFELASGGAVILDEIDDLSLTLQAKLLRFLEERVLRRLGGAREIAVDVRVMALTNRPLEDSVTEGDFRRDLFYRFSMFPITIPPLRNRREDIEPLALHFLQQIGAAAGKTFSGFAPEVRARLLSYDWPGNVREVRNVVERAAILEPGGVVTTRFLNVPAAPGEEVVSSPQAPPATPALGEGIMRVEEVEFVMVQRAMNACGGNQSRAARLLGISRYQLRYLLKRYRSQGRWAGTAGKADEKAS